MTAKINWQTKLEKKIQNYLEGYTACHDFYHLDRVRDNAMRIAKEIKCDKEVLEAAALLHDAGYKDHEADHKKHNIYGMKLAEKWLPETGFPKNKIPDVLEVIRLHDNYHWGHDGEKTEHAETLIIQDADRIDLLGAIGIARLSYFFGERGYPIYTDSPIPETNEVWLNHSLLDQIKRDPIVKYENLNFAASKRIFKKRADFLKSFYKELKKELEFHHKK
jgi:uncharacterized protein